MEQKILLCTPECATMYAMQGWTVFDFHESLDMEPEYYDRKVRCVF